MDTDHKNLIKILNNLLQNNKDAVRNYKGAARQVTKKVFKQFLKAYADQRRSFVNEIYSEIKTRAGIRYLNKENVFSKLNQYWLDVQDFFSKKDEITVIMECAENEARDLADYQEILKENFLPLPTHNVLQKQYHAIVDGLEVIQSYNTVLSV